MEGGQSSTYLRPGADQSSKAAFGKSAFAKTCSNVLYFVIDMTGAHQSSKKQKYFRARFGKCSEQNAFFLKRVKTCSKAFLLFARLMCTCRISNKREHVSAKALLPKAALLDWSVPGLKDKIKHLSLSLWNILKFNYKQTILQVIILMPIEPENLQVFFHTSRMLNVSTLADMADI